MWYTYMQFLCECMKIDCEIDCNAMGCQLKSCLGHQITQGWHCGWCCQLRSSITGKVNNMYIQHLFHKIVLFKIIYSSWTYRLTALACKTLHSQLWDSYSHKNNPNPNNFSDSHIEFCVQQFYWHTNVKHYEYEWLESCTHLFDSCLTP